MPMKRELYADDWEAISHRIRMERAQGRCERCQAPNRCWVLRGADGQIEHIWTRAEINRRAGEIYVWNEGDEEDRTYSLTTERRPIRIVLTVAHLDHNPANNAEANLAALCQRCHLRHDRGQHAQNAARTRAGRRRAALVEAGQHELEWPG